MPRKERLELLDCDDAIRVGIGVVEQALTHDGHQRRRGAESKRFREGRTARGKGTMRGVEQKVLEVGEAEVARRRFVE